MRLLMVFYASNRLVPAAAAIMSRAARGTGPMIWDQGPGVPVGGSQAAGLAP